MKNLLFVITLLAASLMLSNAASASNLTDYKAWYWTDFDPTGVHVALTNSTNYGKTAFGYRCDLATDYYVLRLPEVANIEVGTPYNFKYQIDAGQVKDMSGEGISPTMVHVYLPDADKDSFNKRLVSGNKLKIKLDMKDGSEKYVSFSLAGSGRAMSTTSLNCARAISDQGFEEPADQGFIKYVPGENAF